MRKITSLAVSTILASLLLVGCASKEETKVTLSEEQTKIMTELKEMAHLKQIENEKILKEKEMIKKSQANLMKQKAKLDKEKEELEALKKAMALKNKKSIHSFYSEM